MRRTLLPCLLLCALFAALPASAQSSPLLISTMMDDDQLLYRGDAARDAALKRMRGLGVDYARVTILWKVVAQRAKKGRKQRKRFKAENPRTYPKGNWDRYDRLVKAAQAEKVGIYFNITGPGPRWAHRRAPRGEARSTKGTWMPKEREFFKFVQAVGKRYSGKYRDENEFKTILPRVSMWSIYNEPNQSGWLTPQWRGGMAMSPVLYRELWYYGRVALDATGHGDDVILVGETAPLGSTGRGTRDHLHPKTFIRELFCIAPNGVPYTGAAAAKRRCGRLRQLGGSFRAWAWAHHPYTKKAHPLRPDSHPDSITMANIGDLSKTLDQVAAASGIGAPKYSIHTEYGYETDPPDPFSGISPELQAEYINLGEYLAYADPRTVGQAQFLLRDVGPVKRAGRNTKRRWFTYQSGLFTHRGAPKPAVGAYAVPLVHTGYGSDGEGHRTVKLWGGVRFFPNGTTTEVFIQHRPAGASTWATVGDIQEVGPFGYYETERPHTGSGTWRAVWVNPTNHQHYVISREVEVR